LRSTTKGKTRKPRKKSTPTNKGKENEVNVDTTVEEAGTNKSDGPRKKHETVSTMKRPLQPGVWKNTGPWKKGDLLTKKETKTWGSAHMVWVKKRVSREPTGHRTCKHGVTKNNGHVPTSKRGVKQIRGGKGRETGKTTYSLKVKDLTQPQKIQQKGVEEYRREEGGLNEKRGADSGGRGL